MAMRPQLKTLNALAVEFGVAPRTIAERLRQVLPDGKVGRRDAWYIKSVWPTLAEYPLRDWPTSDRGADLGTFGRNKLADAIDATAKELAVGLDTLRSEVGLEKRRLRAEQVGPLIGRLDRQMRDAAGGVVPAAYCDRVVGAAIGELLSLCGWQLSAT